MKLSKEDVKKIADLAKIEIKDEELLKYGEDISSILAYVAKLQEIDTSTINAETHITSLLNTWREDELHGCTEDEKTLILENMPDKSDSQLKTINVFKK